MVVHCIAPPMYRTTVPMPPDSFFGKSGGSSNNLRVLPYPLVSGARRLRHRRLIMSKVYFITGAGRGMGVNVVRAALAAGHQVAATGRRPDAVANAVGAADDLLVVQLDITNPADTEAAVQAAVERFGRIDVLINNAAAFQAGFFEEVSPEQFRAQMEVNFFGALNVTRAVLPVMRRQRSGQ